MFNLAVIPHFLLHYKIINTISSLRSSRPEVFCKKGVLRKFAKLLGKNLCQSLFLIKLQAFLWILWNFFYIFFYRTPLVAASILCQNSFLFCFTVFSECIFSNCLKHLKRFRCECEHTLFQGLETILF